MGFVIPAVRIQDNLQVPSNTYVIPLEIEVGRGDLRPNMLMIMDDGNHHRGETTTEPTLGCQRCGFRRLTAKATFQGYTVVDSATVITTHITELIKDNMDEFFLARPENFGRFTRDPTKTGGRFGAQPDRIERYNVFYKIY